jgi:transposase
MFWGFFTASGPGSLVPVNVMMNSSKYIEILKSRVLTFPQNYADVKGAFQHDLAPCNKSKAVKKFIQENKISILDWPGNSPDMNPIGNLWNIQKKRLGKMDCSTEERMVTNMIKVWSHDSGVKNICSKLVESVPEHVQEVIYQKGDTFLTKLFFLLLLVG